MSEVADPRAMGLLAGVRWWAGWHPVMTILAGGGLLGFLLANAIVTWWLRWLGIVAGAANVVRAAIAPIVGFILLGLVIGGVVWYLGVREVNRRFHRGPAAYVDRHQSPLDPAHVLVEAGADAGAGRAGRGLLSAPKHAEGHGLWFGPTDVAIRPVTVDVAGRRIRIGSGERVVAYDRIVAVEAADDSVTIETADGEPIELDASQGGDPAAVASVVAERVAD